MSDDRYRMQLGYQLDVTKDDQLALYEFVQSLKRERKYSWAIRLGLTLVRDLSAGKVDTLLDAYPWVGAAVAAATRIDDDVLDRLELLLSRLEAGESAGAPQAMAVPQFDAPVFDDDDDDFELVVQADTDIDYSNNFLESLLVLNDRKD